MNHGYYWVRPLHNNPAPSNAEYVVLDIANDVHARKALVVYAESLAMVDPDRAQNILDRLHALEVEDS